MRPQNTIEANSLRFWCVEPPHRDLKTRPNTRVYIVSINKGLAKDQSTPINEPRYRPSTSRKVNCAIKSRCRHKLENKATGLKCGRILGKVPREVDRMDVTSGGKLP